MDALLGWSKGQSFYFIVSGNVYIWRWFAGSLNIHYTQCFIIMGVHYDKIMTIQVSWRCRKESSSLKFYNYVGCDVPRDDVSVCKLQEYLLDCWCVMLLSYLLDHSRVHVHANLKLPAWLHLELQEWWVGIFFFHNTVLLNVPVSRGIFSGCIQKLGWKLMKLCFNPKEISAHYSSVHDIQKWGFTKKTNLR